MQPFMIIALIWIVIGVIGFIIFIIATQVDKKRRADLAKFASELGLEFHEVLTADDELDFSNFQLANQGHSRKASNAIIADSGELRMAIFEYRFTVGGGKNQSVRRQSVVLAKSDLLSMPDFYLAPETFFHRIGQLLGNKDIDFDEDPKFSNEFVLQGQDELAVRSFFNSERRNRFHNLTDVTIEAAGNCFIFYQPSKRWKVEDTKLLMEKAFSIYGILQS
jgi:hypothetical protein